MQQLLTQNSNMTVTSKENQSASTAAPVDLNLILLINDQKGTFCLKNGIWVEKKIRICKMLYFVFEIILQCALNKPT